MSEYDFQPTCDHVGCPHPYRLEYCELEAKDIEGDASVAIEMIEHLLYEKGVEPEEQLPIQYRGDKNVHHTYEVIQTENDTYKWPIHRTTATIVHDRDNERGTDSYFVYVKWNVPRAGTANDEYYTVYTFDQFSHAVFGTIEEPDLSIKRLSEKSMPPLTARPITPYDISQLFTYLEQIEDMLDAGESEAAREA